MRDDENTVVQLVKTAKTGDDEAFERLYGMIYKSMYQVAYYMLNSKEDAEDAVADAVFDMYKGIKALKKPESFRAWAMKILSVKCKMKMKEYYIYADEMPDENHASDENVESSIVNRTVLENALRKLGEEERIIVLCNLVAGMSGREMSMITGLKEATVRSKLSRALTKLRTGMEV